MNHALLKSVFGHDDFRPGQKELIDAVQNGRDKNAAWLCRR
jgi:superfamily II DNA helicase RecQ